MLVSVSLLAMLQTSVFNVSSSTKHPPSARCTCASSFVAKDFDIFEIKALLSIVLYNISHWFAVAACVFLFIISITSLPSNAWYTQILSCICTYKCRSLSPRDVKALTVYARSNTVIVDSNPTRGKDVCVYVYSVFMLFCVCSGLETGWSPVQGVLPTGYKLRNWKSGQGPQGL
jgi:hypothetical protein